MDMNAINHAKIMYCIFHNVGIFILIFGVIVMVISLVFTMVTWLYINQTQEQGLRYSKLYPKEKEALSIQSRNIKIYILTALTSFTMCVMVIGLANYYKASLITYGLSLQQIEQMVGDDK